MSKKDAFVLVTSCCCTSDPKQLGREKVYFSPQVTMVSKYQSKLQINAVSRLTQLVFLHFSLTCLGMALPSGRYPHQLAIQRRSHRHIYIDTDHYNTGSSVVVFFFSHVSLGLCHVISSNYL